jgi:hypothetical protein
MPPTTRAVPPKCAARTMRTFVGVVVGILVTPLLASLLLARAHPRSDRAKIDALRRNVRASAILVLPVELAPSVGGSIAVVASHQDRSESTYAILDTRADAGVDADTREGETGRLHFALTKKWDEVSSHRLYAIHRLGRPQDGLPPLEIPPDLGELVRMRLADDLDGDGSDDFIVTARSPYSNPTPGSSAVVALSAADGRTLWRRQGPPGCLGFGVGIEMTPDADGDGTRDIAVVASGPNRAPSLHVLSGRSGASIADLVFDHRVYVDASGDVAVASIVNPYARESCRIFVSLSRLDRIDGLGGMLGSAVACVSLRRAQAHESDKELILEGHSCRPENASFLLGCVDIDEDGFGDLLAMPVHPVASKRRLALLSGRDLRELRTFDVADLRTAAISRRFEPAGDWDGDCVDDVALLTSDHSATATSDVSVVILSGRTLELLGRFELRSR